MNRTHHDWAQLMDDDRFKVCLGSVIFVFCARCAAVAFALGTAVGAAIVYHVMR